MYKIQQFFNYLTLILAVITVSLSIYCIIEKRRMYICFSLMILTLIFNGISRVYNEKSMNLTKDEKKMLSKLKEEVKKLNKK